MDNVFLQAFDDEFVKIAKSSKPDNEPNLNFFERHGKKMVGSAVVGGGIAALGRHFKKKSDQKKSDAAEAASKAPHWGMPGSENYGHVNSSGPDKGPDDLRRAAAKAGNTSRTKKLGPASGPPTHTPPQKKVKKPPKNLKAPKLPDAGDINFDKLHRKAMKQGRKLARNLKRGL